MAYSYFYTYLGSTRATPAKAAALTASLPAAQQVLWVASPVPARAASNAPAQAAAYLDVIAAHPNLRVETLPNALNVVTTGAANGPVPTSWSDIGASVVSSMVTGYATGAYQLPLASAKATAVLYYAEAQLGKPYLWAGAGTCELRLLRVDHDGVPSGRTGAHPQ
ncbi:MAG: hypothetical protein M3137_01665, partial [Actinomycetota bacterium]|nr:hypothetical protein [Actinomycetota bacterium]